MTALITSLEQAGEGSREAFKPWKDVPVGQFAPWMTPSQRPAYEDTPFRHWVMVEGFCEHHGSIWARSQVGEAVIRRDSDDDAYQGYRRSDIEEIERRGDMDRGTGIVTFWMPWGNFPPVPTDHKSERTT